MNRSIRFLLLLCFSLTLKAGAQGTAFNYQGRLNDAGGPASSVYDFRFTLFNAATNGLQTSSPATNTAVGVTNGLFQVALDFGPGLFTGTNYWIEIGVRTNGAPAFTTLAPRQPLLAVPYAIFANGASNLLGTLPATQLVGTLPSAQVAGNYSGAVTFPNAANSFSGSFNGTFTGTGSGLTSLNGSAVASGTVADARLSANVALLNANQTYTGSNLFTAANAFTNRGNSFVGSFYGNGLVGWNQVLGTSIQAVPDTGYLLLNSGQTTVTLPSSASLQVGDIVRISGAGAGGWKVVQNAGQSISGLFYSSVGANWIAAVNQNYTLNMNYGWQCAASSADGYKMVAGNNQGIYTSIDSGKTWNYSSYSYTLVALASSGDGTQLVGLGSTGGLIYHSTNSGVSWQSISTTTGLQAVTSSADGSRLAIAVNGSGVYFSVNAGTTWFAGLGSAAWSAIASSSDGLKLVAAINGNNIYTSANGGTNWTLQSGSPSAAWSSLASSSDGTKLAAAVNGGGIYTSPNSGVTWTQQTNAPSSAWASIAMSADGGRLVAGVNGGGVYISSDGGITWVPQNLSNQNWKTVTCSADGSKVLAGYATSSSTGGLYYWTASAHSSVSTAGTSGSLIGGQNAAVELQYIGNNQFMPVSMIGNLWSN